MRANIPTSTDLPTHLFRTCHARRAVAAACLVLSLAPSMFLTRPAYELTSELTRLWFMADFVGFALV